MSRWKRAERSDNDKFTSSSNSSQRHLRSVAPLRCSLRRMIGLPELGKKYDPEVYLEHQKDVLEISKRGREALPEGEEGDKMWAQVLMNRKEAKRLVSGYRQAGHGVLAPGTETTVKVGIPRDTTIGEGQRVTKRCRALILPLLRFAINFDTFSNAFNTISHATSFACRRQRKGRRAQVRAAHLYREAVHYNERYRDERRELHVRLYLPC